MAFKKFGHEDQEGNSETVASLFRECSGLGAEVTAVEASLRGDDGLTANDEKVARFDVEMVETASDFLL
jgi:hypothetical protein